MTVFCTLGGCWPFARCGEAKLEQRLRAIVYCRERRQITGNVGMSLLLLSAGREFGTLMVDQYPRMFAFLNARGALERYLSLDRLGVAVYSLFKKHRIP